MAYVKRSENSVELSFFLFFSLFSPLHDSHELNSACQPCHLAHWTICQLFFFYGVSLYSSDCLWACYTAQIIPNFCFFCLHIPRTGFTACTTLPRFHEDLFYAHMVLEQEPRDSHMLSRGPSRSYVLNSSWQLVNGLLRIQGLKKRAFPLEFQKLWLNPYFKTGPSETAQWGLQGNIWK